MSNRVITLYQLEELLGEIPPRAIARRAHRVKRPRPAPATPASRGARPAAGAPSEPKAQALDFGTPIELRYDDQLTRAASLDPAPPVERALGAGVHVESFETDDDGTVDAETAERSEDEPERIAIRDEEDESPYGRDAHEAGTRYTAGTDDERHSYGTDGDEEDSRSASAGTAERVHSPAYAAQLASVERDLSALRTQQRAPATGAERVAREDEPATAQESPPPRSQLGHDVFDRMARGMAFATEFRLPPVTVSRMFQVFDKKIEADERASVLAREAESGAPVTGPARGAPAADDARAAALPGDHVLAQDLAAIAPSEAANHIAPIVEQLSQPHLLRHFAPEEVVLTAEEALDVLLFFWPDTSPERLGMITDEDREFAQALLVEALDKSHAIGMVETIFKTFFMKVPTSFKSIRNMVVKVAKKAIEDRWFTRVPGSYDPEKVQIYESVRVSIAARQRPVWKSRINDLGLIGY